MEKKFNIVVGEDGTVKLPDAVLEKLEVKPDVYKRQTQDRAKDQKDKKKK